MSKTLKSPSSEPAIRMVMMPRDTNAEGSIFGGVILALIDQAAYVEAVRQAHACYVTVAMHAVEFHQPVFVGDVLSLYADATKCGKSSLTHWPDWPCWRKAQGDFSKLNVGLETTRGLSNGNGLPWSRSNSGL